MFGNIRAIAFDLDGTLIDTSSVVLKGFHTVFDRLQSRGVVESCPSDETFLGTFGTVDDEIWKGLLPNLSQEEREEAMKLHEKIIVAETPNQRLLIPGAYEVLQALHGKYTLATASNCGVTYLNLVLDTQKIRSFITH